MSPDRELAVVASPVDAAGCVKLLDLGHTQRVTAVTRSSLNPLFGALPYSAGRPKTCRRHASHHAPIRPEALALLDVLRREAVQAQQRARQPVVRPCGLGGLAHGVDPAPEGGWAAALSATVPKWHRDHCAPHSAAGRHAW